MIRQEYLDYVAGFSNLNPYELDHMSEKMYVQMEKILQNRTHDDQAEVQFSPSDIKDVVTKAMRCIYIELANQKKVEFDLQLEKIKSMTFDPEEISHESVIAHKQKMAILHPQDNKNPAAKRQGHRSTEAA